MPLVDGQYLQRTEQRGIVFLRQQKVQAFRCNDQHFRHPPFLFLPFTYFSVPIANADTPDHAGLMDHLFHGAADILGQGPQRSYPQELQSSRPLCLVSIRMTIDDLEQRAEKDGESLAATRWRIDQTRLPVQDMLPGFFLEGERFPPLSMHPLVDDLVP